MQQSKDDRLRAIETDNRRLTFINENYERKISELRHEIRALQEEIAGIERTLATMMGIPYPQPIEKVLNTLSRVLSEGSKEGKESNKDER